MVWTLPSFVLWREVSDEREQAGEEGARRKATRRSGNWEQRLLRPISCGLRGQKEDVEAKIRNMNNVAMMSYESPLPQKKVSYVWLANKKLSASAILI